MFNGSYIQVILDIAENDPHCKLSFVKSDLENARKELAELQAAQQGVEPTGLMCDHTWSTQLSGNWKCVYCGKETPPHA